jgi:hypothetical protein
MSAKAARSMSSTAASDPTRRSINPEIGMMASVLDHLIPLFITTACDATRARQMAMSAIDAYQPETQADYVNVARTIAFSMASLALLGKTTSPDMTMPDQMRAFTRAIALNRSADQSERTMMQRRRYQQANRHAEQLDAVSEGPALDEAEVQAAVADAIKEYLAIRPADSTAPATPDRAAPPAAATSSETPLPQPSLALLDAVIRYSGPRPVNAHPGQPPSHRTELLRHGAMQPVVAETIGQHRS